MSEISTPLALASAINEWFPDLGGRVLAVSECDITKDNQPTLPLCMIALVKETADHDQRSGRMTITEHIVVEMWFKNERYRKSDNSESPFWAFFDYTTLRNFFLNRFLTWVSPSGNRMSYKGLDVDSNEFCVMVALKLEHDFTWCENMEDQIGDGKPVIITANLTRNCKEYCKQLDPLLPDKCSPEEILKRS